MKLEKKISKIREEKTNTFLKKEILNRKNKDDEEEPCEQTRFDIRNVKATEDDDDIA